MSQTRIRTRAMWFVLGVLVGVVGMLAVQALVIASMPAELAYRPVQTYRGATAPSPYVVQTGGQSLMHDWRDPKEGGWFPPFGTFVVPGTPGGGFGGPRTLELPDYRIDDRTVPEPGTLWLVLLAAAAGGLVYGLAWLRSAARDMDNLEENDDV
jgi:H+/Cl- antiporter ClcA